MSPITGQIWQSAILFLSHFFHEVVDAIFIYLHNVLMSKSVLLQAFVKNPWGFRNRFVPYGAVLGLWGGALSDEPKNEEGVLCKPFQHSRLSQVRMEGLSVSSIKMSVVEMFDSSSQILLTLLKCSVKITK